MHFYYMYIKGHSISHDNYVELYCSGISNDFSSLVLLTLLTVGFDVDNIWVLFNTVWVLIQSELNTYPLCDVNFELFPIPNPQEDVR